MLEEILRDSRVYQDILKKGMEEVTGAFQDRARQTGQRGRVGQEKTAVQTIAIRSGWQLFVLSIRFDPAARINALCTGGPCGRA